MTHSDSSPLAVITGAGGGLAPAVALAFARAGHRLALITRPGSEAPARALAQRLQQEAPTNGGAPTQARVFGVDLADHASCSDGLERVEAAMGAAAGLLNLAGGFAMGGPASHGPQLLERMLTLNLHTAVNATTALLPGMLERGHGFVAAIGANAVLAPAPGMGAYAAAKSALAAYQRSLAAEVGKQGVNAALLIPAAAIDTPGNRQGMPNADRSKWLAPAALADALLFLARTGPGGVVHELVIRPH